MDQDYPRSAIRVAREMKEHITFFRLRELALKYSPEGKRNKMDSVRLAAKLRLGLVALRISG